MNKTAVFPPSPCLAICTYTRRGHCIGCSMTQAQKRLFNGLKAHSHREEFIEMIRDQQSRMGGYDGWEAPYRKKCFQITCRS